MRRREQLLNDAKENMLGLERGSTGSHSVESCLKDAMDLLQL